MGRSRIRLKLSWRIIIACLLLVCAPVVLAWSMGLYDAMVSRSVEHELQQACDAAAEEIAQRGEAALGDPARMEALARQHGVMLRVLDQRGQPRLATSAGAADDRYRLPGWWLALGDYFYGPTGPEPLAQFERTLGPEALRPEVQTAIKRREPAATMRLTPQHHLQIFYRAQPLSARSETIYVTRVSRRSVRALYDFRYQLLKLTLALLIGAVAMAAWLMWGLVRPIRRLQRDVRAAVAGTAEAQLELDRADELGELSRDFATLTDQLRRRQQLTAQLAADFAHDLKSPLSTMTTAAELLDSERAAEPHTRKRLADNIERAAGHIGRSIEALLQLARLDEQLPQEPHQQVDMSQLARALVTAQRERHDHITITLSAPDEAIIYGIAKRLTELLDNLLQNALVFANSQIKITLVCGEQTLALYISDDGPGVSEGNRARIFQRFFTNRPQGAPPGSGLGLAIVQTIAEAHGGGVTLLSSNDDTQSDNDTPPRDALLRGATFQVTLAYGEPNVL